MEILTTSSLKERKKKEQSIIKSLETTFNLCRSQIMEKIKSKENLDNVNKVFKLKLKIIIYVCLMIKRKMRLKLKSKLEVLPAIFNFK